MILIKTLSVKVTLKDLIQMVLFSDQLYGDICKGYAWTAGH